MTYPKGARYDVNPHSAAYSYVMKFEKDCRDTQFPMYMDRLRDIIKGSVYSLSAYFNLRKAQRETVTSSCIPSKLQNDNWTFLENCFAIYGPAKIKKALLP